MKRSLRRLEDKVIQAWTIAVKDVRVYYLTLPMIMFGRIPSCFSPLTYTQDLMNHALLGQSYLSHWLDLALLPPLTAGFLAVGARLHHRGRVVGY